jgi:nickel transport protein
MKRSTLLISLAVIALLGMVTTVFAHGAAIDYQIESTVHITATYDSGEPMSEAQVAVFSPEDKQNPWMVDVTDGNGNFSFTPDVSMAGEWDVQVRQAGHGDMIHINLNDTKGSDGSFTVSQIVVMSVSILWGLIGTALYFKKGKKA